MDKISTSIYGMHLDQLFFQRKAGFMSYALNANIQSKDGRGITYTNEASNQLCVQFPDGFIVIGSKLILAKNEVIFALYNPDTGMSELGKVKNYNCNNLSTLNVEYNCTKCGNDKLDSSVIISDTCCTYEPIVTNVCLNFSLEHPVRMVYKITNCGYKLYITDDYNDPRVIDLDDPEGVDSCRNPLEFDCDRIKIFKDFCLPNIKPTAIASGGSLEAGVYQAVIAYTDLRGNEYTDYFEATNPIPIFERELTEQTDYLTNKSIKFKVTHNTDIFEYFKLVIIKTVNETVDYIEAGVYKVAGSSTVTFTNNDKTLPRTSLDRIRTRKPNYTKAKLIEDSADHLLLADLEADPDYNLQPFANKLKLYWETVSMPYDSNNNYSNPLVAGLFRTYMRDEVYPIGIRFKLKNGKYTKAYHIPNRVLTADDRIAVTNDDAITEVDCDPTTPKQKWEVYNTGSSLGGTPLPSSSSTFPDDRICNISRHQYGEFAAWESSERYPCDERIWGDLADTPIRYHKFPDSLITHIHDNFNLSKGSDEWYNLEYLSTVYPIGLRIDESIFNSALTNTFVFDPATQDDSIPMSELICGFEIVRGNRVGNKSIEAKGLMYDVGKVNERDGGTDLRTYFIPNYPYNDLRGDAYLAANRNIYTSPDPNDAEENAARLFAYPNFAQSSDDDYRRFTFHSPDTHFQKPTLGGLLKIETEEFGVQQGHFVQVEDHPRYKFLTKLDGFLAGMLGSVAAIKLRNESDTEIGVTAGVTKKGTIEFNYSDLINTANAVHETIRTLIPRRNFAYAYHSRGVYNNYFAVPNDGKKIRRLEIAKYLSPNNQNVGDTNSVHNYGRESSVYLRTNKKYRPYLTSEKSRFTLGNNDGIGTDWCKHPERFELSKIRSYYASIKRDFPDQYGNIDNVDYLSTGYTATLVDGKFVQTYYPSFGGDIFITRFALKRKMPFFVQNVVGKPDEVDFDYDLVPNVGFPLYYIGTSPDELKLKEIISTGDIAAIVIGLLGALAGSVGEGLTAQLGNITAILAFGTAGVDIYSKLLSGFVPKNNLDCDNTPAGATVGFGTESTSILGLDVKLPTLTIGGVTIDDATLFYQSGKFYLANYGIPNFFVESDVNTEYRHARNEKEENFYPNVGSGVPDNWLQEKNVPILHDNKYNYNATYSIQNNKEFIESFNNYNFDKLCQSDFPNRVIYSEKSLLEENFDNWLKYAYNNYHDFDKSNGKIVGIHALDNERILVRFENTFQIWNTRITIPSSSALEVSLSNSGMFGQPPQEYIKTYTGVGGSQHIAFEKTKAGSFWVDAKRGSIFRFSQNLEEISQSNYNWFKENLPFRILKDFPDYDIDNNYKDIGIAICWDERFQRLFITKKDYELKPEYKGRVYTVNNLAFFIRPLDIPIQVQLTDPEYFIDRSFTIAWSPIINDWVSFYSFLPNYYISHPTHFQSGLQNSLWNHNLSNLSYQVYYNDLHPYILEFPISNMPQSEYLKSVTVNADILKYTSETDFYSTKSVNKENYNIFFNKAIIYNKEQCSGYLNLVETPLNNLYERRQYPKYNQDSIDILYGKYDKVYTFNTFFDATREHSNGQPVFTDEWASIQPQYPIDKVLNQDNLAYNGRYKKAPIKSNECYVRLIQDVHQRYKFVNNFEIFQQENKNQNN